MKKIVFITVALVFLLAVDSYSQCAMCRATVGSNLSEGRGVIGTGLNFGILYLLLTPYILVGSLIFFYLRAGKQNLKEKLALETRLKKILR